MVCLKFSEILFSTVEVWECDFLNVGQYQMCDVYHTLQFYNVVFQRDGGRGFYWCNMQCLRVWVIFDILFTRQNFQAWKFKIILHSLEKHHIISAWEDAYCFPEVLSKNGDKLEKFWASDQIILFSQFLFSEKMTENSLSIIEEHPSTSLLRSYLRIRFCNVFNFYFFHKAAKATAIHTQIVPLRYR